MIVTEKQLNQVLEDIEQEPFVGLDTETFGVKYSDHLFSIIISTALDDYYFNFLDLPDHLGNYSSVILPRDIIPEIKFTGTLCIHNALFDLEKLKKEGNEPRCEVHCTQTTQRVLTNNWIKYNLDTVARHYGFKKLDTVEEYIKKHKLYSQVQVPGKKKKEKDKHFNLVPFDILIEYGIADARAHRDIALIQLEILNETGL